MKSEETSIEKLFALLDGSQSDVQLIDDESYILQAKFLSEIERISRGQKIIRKELAEKINISPSYLTQIFRGDKPLNFQTLAKIKRALNINFDIKAKSASEYLTFTEPLIVSFSKPVDEGNLVIRNYEKYNQIA